MKTTTFSVQGRGDFPFDMLRYACAWPESSHDAAVMTQRGRRIVTLVTDRGFKSRSVPLGEHICKRFASFGWPVIIADGLERDDTNPTGWSF